MNHRLIKGDNIQIGYQRFSSTDSEPHQVKQSNTQDPPQSHHRLYRVVLQNLVNVDIGRIPKPLWNPIVKVAVLTTKSHI